MKVTDEQIIYAVNNCKSAREAGALLGINHNSFIKRAKKLGIYDNIRLKENKNRRHTVDDNAFKNMDCECAYWLGYIDADGSVVDKTLRFSISRIDKEHLYKFLEYIKSDYDVKDHIAHYTDDNHIRHNFEACYLKICSDEIVNTLKLYGIVQGKKYKDINYLAYIPDEYNMEFIFGLFDGDGSVGYYNNRFVISLCSTKSMTSAILRTLEIYNIKANVQHREQIDVIFIYNSYVKQFFEIYSKRYRLQRKLNIFKTVFN